MRPTLFDRLGHYCSYCEYPVRHVPHAEHVVPKDRFAEWRDRWDNLVVGCTYCNGRKGDKLPAPENVDQYLWPTRDNTARAFTYANVIPEVAPDLDPALHYKAAHLRGLVQLGVSDDDRANTRAETFIMAQRYFSKFAAAPDPALAREAIVNLAVATGFFSVWMEVFATDPAMRRGLIDSFIGTAQECFDPATTAPIPRPGGRL
ncbi:MAG: HNH endonuclease signature motif containing protein [Byssovorax sp.]